MFIALFFLNTLLTGAHAFDRNNEKQLVLTKEKEDISGDGKDEYH